MPFLEQPPVSIYIHIPWCPTRCIYCDFNTYVDGEDSLKASYQAALKREIETSGTALGRPPLDTIFFGGGTPTTLTTWQFDDLMESVQTSFQFGPEIEITAEANPGTLSTAYLRALRRGGVNRLSLGVQSFADDELTFLSRLHSAAAARRAFEQARAAGFGNISIDLIFNLPQQSRARWEANLHEALKLEPDHFSIYSLIIEPATPLYRQISQGITPEPDDDLAADMYEAMIEILGQAGYTHYEISNWAKAGGEAEWQTPRLASAHNLIYWRNQAYLGLGAGAYGTLNGQRWANVKGPQSYIARVEAGGSLGPARDEMTFEVIEPETAMSEHMLLGLRLVREGVSAVDFEDRFGQSLPDRYAEAIAFGLSRDLIEWLDTPAGPHLRLTRSGRILANQVIVRFLN